MDQTLNVDDPLRRSTDEIFEYACHGGNSGLASILAGACAQERSEVTAHRRRL